MNIGVKPDCSFGAMQFSHGCGHHVRMMNARRKTYLRDWRKATGRTLEQVADHLNMTHGQLSKIERGVQPYNQDLLEALAELYMVDVVDLIYRPPGVVHDINKVVQLAQPEDQAKILAVVRTITGIDENAA